MKVKFFDKAVIKYFTRYATIIITVFSTASIFIDITKQNRLWILGLLILSLFLIYIICFICCKRKKQQSIKINQTKIVIKQGDIFEEKGKKVIAFNEYFDTIVDDQIIASDTLNGIFITRYISDIDKFDAQIRDTLKNKIIFADNSRKAGKTIKYPLGTLVPYNDFLLLAYSRFDEDNRAFLTPEDIPSLYMTFWKEIDRYKACSSIVMPILGSKNLVRNVDYTPQELIELILWTFKMSKIKLTNDATLTIIVHGKMAKEINFAKFADLSD